jgi:hypothetical protein
MNFKDTERTTKNCTLKNEENPLYIEFELNNDDGNENEYHDNNTTVNYERNDTNQSYCKLESSRKEERRPYSPPFKLEQ